MVGVNGFANLQSPIREFVTEKLESLNLAFGVEKVCIIENIDKTLIILVTGLDTCFGLLCIVIYLTNTICQTAFNVKADQNAKMLVLKLFIDFLKTGEIEISDKEVGCIASGKDVVNDFRQELVLIGYQVLAHNVRKKKTKGYLFSY